MFEKDNSKSSEESRPSTRRRKRGVHGRGRQKLTVPEIPGYYLRWCNDTGSNMFDITTNDDYEYVLRDEISNQVGESGDGNTDIGSKVRVLVDKDENGSPIYQYLMKKKLEFHEEDVVENERLRRKRESSLRRGDDSTGKPVDHQYGSIN